MVIEKRKIDRNDVRVVSSNYWDPECERETVRHIEEGLWVCFIADCIGHTRAVMFENDGERFLVKKYGDCLQVAEDEDLGSVCYRLR